MRIVIYHVVDQRKPPFTNILHRSEVSCSRRGAIIVIVRIDGLDRTGSHDNIHTCVKLTKGVMDTQFGIPPVKSLQYSIPVSFGTVASNAFCWGPAYIASRKAEWTGPLVPWNEGTEFAPFSSCWASGGENDSA